ncbi:hypothetical protein B0H13DRAFT_307271 [Mycena leptocephala]|nr:hypothetical protein B0H13DRAFT_307271 [Mycena leptocephala]
MSTGGAAVISDAVNLTPKLAEVFGAKNGQTAVATIDNIVQNFDFSRVSFKDKTRDDFLHTGLAPSFGTLTRESIMGMDERLKIMIAGTNRELAKVLAEDRCWDKIISVLIQNPLMESMTTPTANIARTDKFIKTGPEFLEPSIEHDDGVVREPMPVAAPTANIIRADKTGSDFGTASIEHDNNVVREGRSFLASVVHLLRPIKSLTTPTASIARADKPIQTGSESLKVNIEHDDGVVRELVVAPTANIIAPTAKITKADKVIKKFNREYDDGVVRDVHSWFTTLIGDEDVLNSTKIDIKVIANIVGAAIDSFEASFPKNEQHREKTVVDITVLRYPDIDHPYFKVYRVQLTAWRVLGKEAHGITGQYNMRLFAPRDSVIVGMRAESKKKAMKEADDMFV